MAELKLWTDANKEDDYKEDKISYQNHILEQYKLVNREKQTN